MLNKCQVNSYLSRIGIEDELRVCLHDLNALVNAQLTHVPFENIDIWAKGSCPKLDIDALYDKIVTRKRGGYCFELNTLFCALLRTLGYRAYQCIASLVHEDRIDPPAHNVIICQLDGSSYVIDVGFGGPVPLGAMPLREGAWNSFLLENDGEFWYLAQQNGTKPSFRFRDIPAQLIEMVPLNFYISQNPDSHFRHILRINQRKPDGTVCTLVDRELRIRFDDNTKILHINNEYELVAALDRYFDILPGTYDLKDI